MRNPNGSKSLGKSRPAVVVVWIAISITTIVGFTALAVDMGYLYLVKAQLQNGADAAVLAGASALLNPDQLSGTVSDQDIAQACISRAKQYAALNKAGSKSIQLDASDVTVGHFTKQVGYQTPFVAGATPYNAVQVWARRADDSSNGPLNLFFARIWGKDTSSLSATATAMLDTKVSGYRPASPSGGPVIPISIRKDKWLREIVNQMGDDEYGYDPETNQITRGGDGKKEISIYPEKQNLFTEERSDGAGNFGILGTGDINVGASTIADRIRNGLNGEDIISMVGKPEITFFTDDGSPVAHDLDGSPGLMTSLKDDLELRIGDVIGFFIHEKVVIGGSNAQFTVTEIQFARVMLVQLTGSPQRKILVVQPAPYIGQDIITDDDAPPSVTAGRVQLVQ